MVEDHTGNQGGNPLLPSNWLLLFDKQNDIFYLNNWTERITHIISLVKPVVDHWLEQELAERAHSVGSIRRPIAPWANAQPLNFVKLQTKGVICTDVGIPSVNVLPYIFLVCNVEVSWTMPAASHSFQHSEQRYRGCTVNTPIYRGGQLRISSVEAWSGTLTW